MQAAASENPEMNEGHGGGGDLKKCLKWYDLISYGVGSTVGAGVLVTIGIVAKLDAGPGVLFSFLFAAAACLISAFCYSEFATRIPLSGSAYTFTYVALGEFLGWFIGWNLTLEYCISASAVARGWSSYFQKLIEAFGGELPWWIADQAFKGTDLFSFSPLSALIIALCTVVLLFGVKDSARFNMVMTIINISTILFVIILGAFHVNTDNWHPFLPFGINGSFAGAAVVFFSYIGFDSVTTLAGEVENPTRDLPIGIVGTLMIASVLYVGVSLVLTGMVNYSNLDAQAPLAAAFAHVGLGWAVKIVAIGSVTALTASTLCSLLAQPRIYYQMAKDGLFFARFATLNRRQAPVFGTVFTGIFAAVLAMFLDLNALADMISIGTLLAFSVVCGGVVMARYDDQDLDPSSKVHLSPRRRSWVTRLSLAALLFVFFLFSVGFSFVFKYSNLFPTNVGFILAIVFTGVPLVVITILIFLRPQLSTPRTFACPFVPFTPLLGMLVNTFLIIQLPLGSIYRVLIWSAVGFLIYFAYGIRHSRLNQISPSERINGEE
eukprot:TRINITY_DN2650_c0_g1_i1.p1 TRINITY_DN2650_c0_g1~~TRINITY_DN2650_c0_g1_i1.p1  ORF type:complete len:593 (+),score=86.29 TRINITY_DN2650_c0_g1_i1:133-1779(+)